MRIRCILVLLLALTLALAGCGKRGGSTAEPTRGFYMGFTNWPYDATVAAVDDTWAKIHDHGDMITIHLDQGVPWPEAYAKTAYPAKVEAELQNYTSHIASDKRIFLQVACCDNGRQNLAGYWNDTGGNQPRPGAWASRTFADQAVADAYVNWMDDLITRYDPIYVNYAVEITDLALNDPTEFTQFPTFSHRVYTALKAKHPTLPLLVSVGLRYPGSAEATTIATAYGQIKNDVDVIGVSCYPYAFWAHPDAGNPDNLPPNWLSQVTSLDPSKPFAIAETGFIAETLDIPAYSLHVVATPTDQQKFVSKLLHECDAGNCKFVSWFCLVDFDALWSGALGSSDIAKIWRDTGLYDETVTPRPALATWDSFQLRRKR